MRLTLNNKLTSTFRKMFNKTLLFVLSLSFFSFISTNIIDSKKISVEDRPNFIFYLADDQDKLDYGTYGNPNVDTKAVDKLASEGI